MDKLYVMYGQDAESMALAIMEKMAVSDELAALGKKRPLVGIKPNLVVAQPAEWGATTEPALVRGVIKYLQGYGFDNLIILEGAWVGDSTVKAFRECGYEELSAEFGVPLLDLKKDKGVKVSAGGLELEVCGSVLDVDYLINMPVLKAHCQTRLTCALKNLKGCIPDREKRRFHTMGLHRPIACLSKIVGVGVTLVDGIYGDLVYEGGGNPVRMDRVIAGRDPVMVDAYAAALLGFDVKDIPYIGMARELGVGSSVVSEVVELNRVEAPGSFPAGREIDRLSRYIGQEQACSPCYSSVVHALLRLDEMGRLKDLPGKVLVGQGHKGRGGAFGVGECAADCDVYVRGCPPGAREIVEALLRWKEGNCLRKKNRT